MQVFELSLSLSARYLAASPHISLHLPRSSLSSSLPPVSPLYLPYISPISPQVFELFLSAPYISPISPLYLPYTSPLSPQVFELSLPAAAARALLVRAAPPRLGSA
jgi:hypothetical protein